MPPIPRADATFGAAAATAAIAPKAIIVFRNMSYPPRTQLSLAVIAPEDDDAFDAKTFQILEQVLIFHGAISVNSLRLGAIRS
jgi:hypothetical protein